MKRKTQRVIISRHALKTNYVPGIKTYGRRTKMKTHWLDDERGMLLKRMKKLKQRKN